MPTGSKPLPGLPDEPANRGLVIGSGQENLSPKSASDGRIVMLWPHDLPGGTTCMCLNTIRTIIWIT